MARKLDRLTIRGFKSIESLEGFELGAINVLIGANGAGKSNFVEFFRLLRAFVERRLQAHVREHGPADGYFFNGVKTTAEIGIALSFGKNGYSFELKPTAGEGLLIGSESTRYDLAEGPRINVIGFGNQESNLRSNAALPGVTGARSVAWWVLDSISNWHVYHFHDTGMTAGMRRDSGIEQTERLDPDGGNLAAFLLHLRTRHPPIYQTIRETVQRIAPYFDDFVLAVKKATNEDQVRLTWRQKEKDYIFSPGHLSDGTIRFICLTTALLQPSPPATIVVDEPELGLHPEALSILAGLFRSVSHRTQIIVATQSPLLVNEFEPEEIITVTQQHGASKFTRLDPVALKEWLEEYSLGELWLKGNLGGGVSHD